MVVCSYHVTYAFQSESTLYSCLNVKEPLARSRHKIWSWSECNWTRTHNHLVDKRTPNHLAKLAKLAKWLSVPLWTKWLWVPVQLQSLWTVLKKISWSWLTLLFKEWEWNIQTIGQSLNWGFKNAFIKMRPLGSFI